MTVVWDWNGTLLDDTEACVAALNDMLSRRRLPSLSLEAYRREFSFPVRDFYERIGMRLDDEDWDELAREYHDSYHSHGFSLNAEAIPALEAVAASGSRQVILSALRQDLLDAATERFGVRRYMDFVCGTDNLDGGSKMDRARHLMSLLGKPPGRDVVVIGDALHDWEVAIELGARCVLFSGGGHSGERLSRVAPTFDSLLDCASAAIHGMNRFRC